MIADGQFVLLRTTLLDFPGRVAAAVFLPGCHLRCPYCHNPELVDPAVISEASAAGGVFNCSLEELSLFLSRRAGILGGLAVSGGEALLHPLLGDIIGLAAGNGLEVKLDTAGMLPDRLSEVLSAENSPVSYVAVDLKTLPRRYDELGWQGSRDSAGENLERTFGVLNSMEIPWEVRTTVVPPLVDEEILGKLQSLASHAPKWVWQAYHPGNTLNPDWGDLEAPDEIVLNKWKDKMKNSARITVR